MNHCKKIKAAASQLEGVTSASAEVLKQHEEGCPSLIELTYMGPAEPTSVHDQLNYPHCVRPAGCELRVRKISRCPASYLLRADVARFDNAAYVANRRGDRCGWWLVGNLASHLRDCLLWDQMPWLRKDSYAKTYFLNPECVARFGEQSL